MPVGTRGTVRATGVDDLAGIGTQVVLANTYHLMLQARRRRRRAARRPAPVHGLGRARAHRLRRLPGVQPRPAGSRRRRRRRHVPLDLRRSTHRLTPEGAVAHPGAARRRHPDAARRVPAAAVAARGRCASAVDRTLRLGRARAGGAAPARRPGAVRHRAGRHRPRAPPSARAQRPSRWGSTATRIGGLSVGERGTRCCRAIDATVAELPGRPAPLRDGPRRPAGHGRGGRPRHRPVRLRHPEPHRPARVRPHRRRAASTCATPASPTDDGPLDSGLRVPGVRPSLEGLPAAPATPSTSRPCCASPRSTTWPGRSAWWTACERRSRRAPSRSLRAEVLADMGMTGRRRASVGPPSMSALILLAVTFILMWVLFILPQQRRLRAHQALVTRLEIGDEVMATSGLYGTITELDDDVVHLEIAAGHRSSGSPAARSPGASPRRPSRLPRCRPRPPPTAPSNRGPRSSVVALSPERHRAAARRSSSPSAS